jgi:hypothetical protein
LPIRIKADLAIGSIKADLDAFKGLNNPFKNKIIMSSTENREVKVN